MEELNSQSTCIKAILHLSYYSNSTNRILLVKRSAGAGPTMQLLIYPQGYTSSRGDGQIKWNGTPRKAAQLTTLKAGFTRCLKDWRGFLVFRGQVS